MVGTEEFASGLIYPAQDRLREVSRAVAIAVMREARDLNVGNLLEDDAIDGAVDAAMWYPEYPDSGTHTRVDGDGTVWSSDGAGARGAG